MLKNSLSHYSFVVIGAFAFVTASGSLNAQVTSSLHTANVENVRAANVEGYWTSQRLLSAKTIELTPRAGSDGMPMTASELNTAVRPNEAAVSSRGGAPSVRASSAIQKVLVSAEEMQQTLTAEQENFSMVIPDASSSFGAHFTTSRVFPDTTTRYYPYSTAGKLFFSDPRTGGNFVCSASVLRPRIIVTAGHCVTHPSTDATQRYFYSRFLFVPAYNNGAAPFGTWTPNTEWITNTWYFSDGSVPNDQDVGILIANDNFGTKLGYITGWLGYYTNQLGNNNVSMLGYPCNLDSCGKMQENFAQTFEFGGNNTYIYGSAMRGGASGGPWIQDFGIAPAGAPAGLLGNNYLVAVTSYGPISTTPMYLGASNLDSRFLSLLSSACGPSTTGNCN